MQSVNIWKVMAATMAAISPGAQGDTPPEIQVVEHKVVIDAPVEAIWDAITTEEGLRGWIAPEVRVELEIDGAYEIYFWPENDPGKRGIEGTRVLSFVPNRMLSYWGSSPPEFSKIHLKNVAWVTYSLRELETGGVEVRQYGCWPKFGEAWEQDFREWVRSAQEIGLERLAEYLTREPSIQSAPAAAGGMTT